MSGVRSVAVFMNPTLLTITEQIWTNLRPLPTKKNLRLLRPFEAVRTFTRSIHFILDWWWWLLVHTLLIHPTDYGLPMKPLFFLKSRNFGLGQTNWAVIVGIWGIFGQTKGQIISKGHFVVFNSSKKQTKNFWPSRLGQKSKFSSSFLLEELTPCSKVKMIGRK